MRKVFEADGVVSRRERRKFIIHTKILILTPKKIEICIEVEILEI